MVRKTKEDAAITRQRIIDAAREVFLSKGVSRTSLEQIANHAGVTRGVVYWHFANKSELFHAMRERAFLPLIDRMDDTLLAVNSAANDLDPLARVEKFLVSTIAELNNCKETRQIYEIMMIKCEYVDELATVLQQILDNCGGIIKNLETTYQQAIEQGIVSQQLSAEQLAMDTHLFFSGLLHMWVKDIDGVRFRNQADSMIQAHFKLRRKYI